MEVAKNTWEFYQKVVKDIQKDCRSADKFVEQAATSMMLGHEFGGIGLNSVSAYETLFVWNLTYNTQAKNNSSLANILKSFSNINEDLYFDWLITNNPLLGRELLMICRLAAELEDNEEFSIAKELFKLRGIDFPESYKYFSKMKEILRAGWIVRNVENSFQENDAAHIMQMFALAMAYFRLDKNITLKQKQVYETILIHEIGEVLAGDIREGTAGHDSKHDIEKQAVEKTFSNLTRGSYFIDLWNEFEERRTAEAQFVYQLDKIDPVLKAKVLDKVLERDDLFNDFYGYEEKRKTFEKGKVKELFNYIKNAEGRKL